MLIKVGSLYLTLGTFNYESGNRVVYFSSGETFRLFPEQAVELERILDEAIATQTTMQAQLDSLNKQAAELNERAVALQQREQYVEGIAQQVMAAQAQQQSKSPILVPGFGRKRG